jgi:hypothetical protein
MVYGQGGPMALDDVSQFYAALAQVGDS